ncbi:molybdopterin synthase sulfur carrier subunit [Pseudomonas sp. 2957]|uniref:Molybdopterin synthase sulfur carrier subunit n=2 Tax=Pseudomonas TaxID=286 RepID=A0A5E7JJR2_PSEFL|nr:MULTISPECIES: MoaD/ThiS family protein [Pseudomonas]AMT87404.1 molybdopterin synthase sulfur carrier subunit [Pseudomonas koreensis]MBB4057800.1 molybdopterin synthase sulfur carrier subunit [Pseudomonas koreensis]MBV4471404.1 MoaD/ThiS family protein [Pseudomonas siliginis]MDR6945447.1 molybdopterin synthase sulfur carrier subunit [Pseudomonas sp. 2957]TSB53888.1 molybdopterin synthase sulfur carrier subunit [Pseudomonas sp. ef1]
MKLTVKFFARYREALGVDSVAVEGDFATVDDVRAHVLEMQAQRDGAEVLSEQNLMCARNEDLCQLDEPVVDGDEVAFFPTVTGG